MTCRYTLLASAVGFLSGVAYNEWGSKAPASQFTSVHAAQLIPTTLDSEPMKIDESGNSILTSMKFGFPGVDTIRSRKGFILSYDRRNRIPHWVFEHLTPGVADYSENVSRSKSEFFEDSTIHKFFRATNSDYRGSGYDRGHMAPAGDYRNKQENLDDTFVLSNIAPQVGKGFNRDAWNNLEKRVRKRLKKYKNLYIVTGPLYLPKKREDGKQYVIYEVIGSNHVAVPTHFFKVWVGERNNGMYDMEAYVMPNAPIPDSVPLKAHLVPRDVIERAAGLLLFEKLPTSKFYRINGQKVIS